MRKATFLILCIFLFSACNGKKGEKSNPIIEPLEELVSSTEKVNERGFIFHPIEHASMVLDWGGTVIYVDPVGGGGAFSAYEQPDLILITDIHGDHLDVPTLEAITVEGTQLKAPKAVFEKLPETLQNRTEILDNGTLTQDFEIEITAIPMYNLRPEALQFHEKGRGNGYVLEKAGQRVYISGDTEDIPEMRNLKNIDIAFVCMNLPYTMTVESAAEGVLAFKPKTVYPYHYRGTDGFSDVEKFKTLVEKGNPDIEVIQFDWYPKEQ